MAGAGGRTGWRARLRSADGAVTIEMVVLLPIAILLLFVVVQAAVYFQGRSIALASAQEGARAGAAYKATDRDGEAKARSFAERMGQGGTLDEVGVAVTRDPAGRSVTVTVTGRTPSLVPGWDPEVSQSSTRPIEEFSAPKDYQNSGNAYRNEPRYTSKPLPEFPNPQPAPAPDPGNAPAPAPGPDLPPEDEE